MSEGTGDAIRSPFGHTWRWVLAFGLVTLAAGIVALAWPRETLLVIAVVFGIQLVLIGIVEFVLALGTPVASGGMRVLYAILGLLSLIVGVWAIRHADLTVLVLAVLLGIYWIVRGAIEIYTALSEPLLPNRGWIGFMGALSVAAGIVVVAIPGISVLTLALVLGIWLVILGIGQLLLAFRLRPAARAVEPGPAGAVPWQRGEPWIRSSARRRTGTRP